MARIKHHKVVSSLPAELEADSVYYVRVGTGFDIYVTNGLGTLVSYELNTKPTYRNKLINGDFRVWQRGTSLTVGQGTNHFLADRWKQWFGSDAGSGTISRIVRSPGRFAYSWQQTAAGSGAVPPQLRQTIENVSTLAGQQAVFSFDIRVTAGTPTLQLYFVQHFGTGETEGTILKPLPLAPSADVTVTKPMPVTLTSNWQRVSVVVDIPSIAGQVVGTSGTDYLAAGWLATNGETFTVELADVQIEASAVATQFESRPIGLELTLCQRYYETARFQWNGLVGVSHNIAFQVPFRITKRAAPTVIQTNDGNPLNLSATPFATAINTQGFLTVRDSTAAGQSQGAFAEFWTADAEV
ncbi:hypothetical protein SAMN05216421_1121 [Halopseudomonas xinjiangensis]|uniref:Uncharacterized protein n=1 Tax=Halopseudomonas xinjiangensis TaxID=487184 RepID=A0A1H1QEQ7_9GAMM|nr:hypothetical protein [Halopseudomonas xinjiangensis]SDS21940.1 hypothetical protein SAMN05216421_1121 [Halopseudomonas xinjiangensis]